MPGKTEFYSNYPELIREAIQGVWNTDKTWRLMNIIHDNVLARSEKAARRIHPAFSDKDIHRVAMLSMRMAISEKVSATEKEPVLLWAMREWLLGDMNNTETLIQNWIEEAVVRGAYKTAMKNLKEFSTLGERFIDSAGHIKRAKNISKRNAKISEDFNKLLSDGVDKKDIYARLSVRHGVGLRQIQRIQRIVKNVI